MSKVLNVEIADRGITPPIMLGPLETEHARNIACLCFLAWLINRSSQLDVPLEGYSKSWAWT